MLNIWGFFLRKEVTSSVCTSAAILTTIIRLFVRRLIFWFDDACALLSMLTATSQMGILLSIMDSGKESSHLAAYYTTITCFFYCTVWLARISILLTIIRIGRPNERSRHLFVVVVVFSMLLGLLIGQVFWVCKPQLLVKTNNICIQAKQLAIFKLVSDVCADLILLTSSLRLFLVIQDKALRFRLSCLFSTCVVTTAVSLVNSSFILTSGGLKVVVIAIVEASVSLIVANIPALSSVFLRVGEHASHAMRRSRVSSNVDFVHPTDTQVSRTTLFETGPMSDDTP